MTFEILKIVFFHRESFVFSVFSIKLAVAATIKVIIPTVLIRTIM